MNRDPPCAMAPIRITRVSEDFQNCEGVSNDNVIGQRRIAGRVAGNSTIVLDSKDEFPITLEPSNARAYWQFHIVTESTYSRPKNSFMPIH